jgi:hypothetical protein
MPIPPDTKDWTWVLERPCPDCGFDAATVSPSSLADEIRANASVWSEVLDRADVAARPDRDVWSALEYGCHVRDVHRVFAERVRLMRETDDPLFANWDQDETAAEGHYSEQPPAEVALDLIEAAAEASEQYSRVSDDGWERVGRRSNGSVFTIASLGRYHLHDLVHHLHDVGVS